MNIDARSHLSLADFAEMERRVLGGGLQRLEQMEANRMVVVTFSATKAEKLAVLYGMSQVRRWEKFVPEETKARMRRRARRR